jgi:hypothetical protein
MRITCYAPDGELTAEIVADVLSLIGERAALYPSAIAEWTRLELLLAYDWAIREHLAASDNPVRRRDRPRFLDTAGSATT